MKCNDCGGQVDPARTADHGRVRLDICSQCWELRGELVDGKIAPIGSSDFEAIRRAMAKRDGTTAGIIAHVLDAKLLGGPADEP